MIGKQFRVKEWKELLKLGGLLDDGSIKMDYVVFYRRYAKYCGTVETIMAYDDRYIISINDHCYPRNAVTILTDYSAELYKKSEELTSKDITLSTIYATNELLDTMYLLNTRQDGQNIDGLSYNIAEMEVMTDLMKTKYKISDADIQKKKEKWLGELER